MEKTDFKYRTFQVTGRELLIFGVHFLWIGLFALMSGIFAMTGAEVLFGDPETWGVWANVGDTCAFTAGTLATGWLMWRFSKPSLVRWLDDERRKGPAGDFIHERPQVGLHRRAARRGHRPFRGNATGLGGPGDRRRFSSDLRPGISRRGRSRLS